mmetsp:Transcript_52918/g.61810  ORF Transcript_52918/g.61810 Transcript_52918/m.61810 type:complete len:82 (-) Transcript_52918:33-278(-)
MAIKTTSAILRHKVMSVPCVSDDKTFALVFLLDACLTKGCAKSRKEKKKCCSINKGIRRLLTKEVEKADKRDEMRRRKRDN